MPVGGLWIRHALAFGVGGAVLFGAGEVGVRLFAGLKGSPLVWHLVIAAVAVVLAALSYAVALKGASWGALRSVFLASLGFLVAGFIVMAGLIYAGLLTPMEAFLLCAMVLFIFGGFRLQQAAQLGASADQD